MFFACDKIYLYFQGPILNQFICVSRDHSSLFFTQLFLFDIVKAIKAWTLSDVLKKVLMTMLFSWNNCFAKYKEHQQTIR